VVGDRLYCIYADICALQQRSVDVVFRHHSARPVDLRQGQRLGPTDRLVCWTKPTQCPPGLPPSLYESLPPTLTVRVVQGSIEENGFRTRQVTLVTTLLDPIAYPKVEIAHLYQRRWAAEIDLRHLKTTMAMDVLRTKSPEMIGKEVALYFLAYNLIRSLMAQAGQQQGSDPLRLAFKGALQHLASFVPFLAQDAPHRRALRYEMLLTLVASEQLPDRSGRVEPRAVKRRPKAYPWLQQPRAVLKERLRH